jgi:hypothetical protein
MNRIDPQHDRPPLFPPRPVLRRTFLASLGAALGPCAAWAQGVAEEQGRPASRLDAMRRVARTATVAEVTDGKAGAPLALRAEPLLLYGDPGRGIHEGALWAWGERGRAAAVMKVESWTGSEGAAANWLLGISALSPRRVSVDFRDGQHWASRKPGLELRPLPDAPAPADTPAQRLTQAKALARRFAAHVDTHRRAGTIQLRLLPKPVDRYEDPDSGLLDGLLFGLVYATNPITLLGLEARTDGPGAPAWRYGFARFGGGEATARLDGKDVWTVPFINAGPANTDLYMTWPVAEGAEEM